MRYLLIIIMAWMMVGCEEDSMMTTSDIRYGTSFGECIGYCVRETTLNGQQITVQAISRDDDKATKTKVAELSKAEALAIRSGIDVRQFQELPATIGCPDCADGGAEWLEMQINGESVRVTFEYGADIDGIKAGVLRLRELTHEMDPAMD
ncbi:hypothetical protein [Marinoscillum sp.]|uniref:hypothetical protein n=1 Tax=Marinoscillum sp. TaxID=2024838 RepID=UPI003BA9760F